MEAGADFRTRKLTDDEMTEAIMIFARERGHNIERVANTALRYAAACSYRRHLKDRPE